MTNWTPTRLSDVIDVKHGFAFKGEYFCDDPTDAILLTPGNFAIGGGFNSNKRKFYRGPVPDEYVLRAGDILVTMTDLSKEADTLGYAARVPQTRERLLHNQRLGKVIRRSDSIDMEFVHWLLRTPEYRNEVLASFTGSTVKHTSPTKILAFEFMMPSLDEQRAIAEILKALDDKIGLNRQTNSTLETMARELFRDWFVDFGPTRAKLEGKKAYLAPDVWARFPESFEEDSGLPQGWGTRRVEELLQLAYGKGLTAGERMQGDVPVYGSGGITGTHNAALVETPTIIVGRKGTVGSLYWEDRPSFPIDTVFYVVPKVPLTYCYYLLCGLGLERMNTDAAVPGLNRNNVYRLESAWPPDDSVITQFDEIASGIRQKIAANNRESERLSQTRAYLLPKLMSGEITVRDAEKQIEEAA